MLTSPQYNVTCTQCLENNNSLSSCLLQTDSRFPGRSFRRSLRGFVSKARSCGQVCEFLATRRALTDLGKWLTPGPQPLPSSAGQSLHRATQRAEKQGQDSTHRPPPAPCQHRQTWPSLLFPQQLRVPPAGFARATGTAPGNYWREESAKVFISFATSGRL